MRPWILAGGCSLPQRLSLVLVLDYFLRDHRSSQPPRRSLLPVLRASFRRHPARGQRRPLRQHSKPLSLDLTMDSNRALRLNDSSPLTAHNGSLGWFLPLPLVLLLALALSLKPPLGRDHSLSLASEGNGRRSYLTSKEDSHERSPCSPHLALSRHVFRLSALSLCLHDIFILIYSLVVPVYRFVFHSTSQRITTYILCAYSHVAVFCGYMASCAVLRIVPSGDAPADMYI